MDTSLNYHSTVPRKDHPESPESSQDSDTKTLESYDPTNSVPVAQIESRPQCHVMFARVPSARAGRQVAECEKWPRLVAESGANDIQEKGQLPNRDSKTSTTAIKKPDYTETQFFFSR